MANAITFGTDGWRALIAEDFTFHNVERVAYAMGKYVKEQYGTKGGEVQVPVLIGYDTRFLADRFATRIAQVLMDMGIAVRLANRDVPTPAIAWSVQLEPTAGAIQVTASHNPPEYCGIKYIPHYAGPATNEITNRIVEHLSDLPADYQHPKTSSVPSFDPQAPYIKAVSGKVDVKKIASANLKVAYDAMYSTSRGYLDNLLKAAGVAVTVLHDWRDPLFGGGMPEPKAEFLTELSATVVAGKFDIGLATDGDADRFAVIDDRGNYMTPNQLLALLTRHLYKNHGFSGVIVRTVATTHLLNKLAKMYGLKVIETPVGFKYIGELMRKEDVLIGGEESGGVSIKGHIPEKDGILANLLMVEMLAYEKKPLSVIWSELLKEAGVELANRRRDLHFSPATQRALMEALKANPFKTIGEYAVKSVNQADGLKFYLDDNNWILVRPSGTEPMIRLYLEGDSPERADKTVAAFVQQVDDLVAVIEAKQVLPSLAVPTLR